MGIGVVPQPQSHHNEILIGIHIENLASDAHSIVARELRLFSPDAAGVVPAEVVAFVIRQVRRGLINPEFAHNPLSIPLSPVQIQAADFGQVSHGEGQPAESVGCMVLLAAGPRRRARFRCRYPSASG